MTPSAGSPAEPFLHGKQTNDEAQETPYTTLKNTTGSVSVAFGADIQLQIPNSWLETVHLAIGTPLPMHGLAR